MKPIPYGRQHITQEDVDAVTQTLQSDFLTQGPAIKEFEDAFAAYVGAKYAVAVANGTAALHLCAMALNVNAGSTVITTPVTFAASANCIRYCGGTVAFADIDPQSALLDIDKLEQMLEASAPGTYSGIVAVDFAGYAVNMERLKKLAAKYNLWIIEDACHAPGGYFTDSNGVQQKCGNGNFAELAIFSFHPVKHIACGEGGMITTNNKELYDRLLLLRTHGITKNPTLLKEDHGGWYYEMQELGYNYRLTDFQAALGVSQLKRADAGLTRRKEIAARYDAAFAGTVIKTFPAPPNDSHAYHLYIIHTPKRKELYDYLREHNIFPQVHYIPVHLQPYYRQLGFRKGQFPFAEQYYDGCLSLPMFPSLTDMEQEFVINTIHEFFKS
jgi:UDP-4-amino-4,6-dideoxy-N-acetyl-beta-L-altrosamine transaminase